MLNFSFVAIFSFILVYQNIIILNEETLILVCFITFCFLIHSKLSKSVHNNFEDQSISIKISVESSLNLLLKELLTNIKVQSNYKGLATDFKNLGDHFLKLSFSFLDRIPLQFMKSHKKIYPKKLSFTSRLEKQTTKLIALLISHKLAKIVSLKKFYAHNFKMNSFLCIDKVMLREYFGTI
uniref:ATP synthase B chain n=1 Tax=Kappaphycus striatus TaxID=88410 RepID=A0A059T1S4_9FLOR|nr:ATP synthase B chain precursor [Kappaphycus striatus]AHG98609.1 ATP synthase B chain precursor [Kappaphycus striatus]